MREPTLKQLGFLRRLAAEVGETVRRPRTSAEATQAIARLEAVKRASSTAAIGSTRRDATDS
jgi:hypothetical protein